MHVIGWFTLLVSAGALLCAQDDRANRVDQIFKDWNKPDRPGAAVAVVLDGRVVLEKGYGSANLEYGIPIGPDTVFHVASVSKQFTAMALVLLEADGKLSLEDKVRKYLPELPAYGNQMAVRDLLQHTSGIRDQWQTLALAGWRLDDVITQQQILRMLFHQRELNFPPRTRHLYSNGGYTLAAEIVKRVSGKPLDDFCTERIFAPLAMTRTHFHEDHQRLVRNRAYSYSTRLNEPVAAPLNYANVGATSLFSTAADLVKWLDNFRSLKVGGTRAIARLQEQAVLADGSRIPYALGVSVSTHRGLKTVSHSGGDAGYRSYVVWFPDQALGVAVVSNAGHFATTPFANRVAAVYAGARMQPESAESSGTAERKFISLDPTSLKRYTGLYRLDGVGLVAFRVEKGKLRFSRMGQTALDLSAITPTRFYCAPPLDGELDFRSAGHTMRVTLSVAAVRLKGERVAVESFQTSDLSKYEGVYWSDELETQYTLTARDGKLVAGHPRHLEITLQPIAKDFFAGSTWFFAEAQFLRDLKGHVTGMTVGGGRVRGIKFVRRGA